MNGMTPSIPPRGCPSALWEDVVHAQSVGPVGIEPTTRGTVSRLSQAVWDRLASAIHA